MAIQVDTALIFFASILVAGILAIFGNWWITGYFSQDPHPTKYNWKLGRFFTILILISYLIFFPSMANLLSLSNTTIPSETNTTIINNYYFNTTNFYFNNSSLAIENCRCLPCENRPYFEIPDLFNSASIEI